MNLIKFLKTYQAELILALAVILISITAFNMGKIAATKQQKTPLTVTDVKSAQQAQKTTSQPTDAGSVVASKNSASKLYHFPWCASGSKISEKNKITFATEAAAISAGYTLAGNCRK